MELPDRRVDLKAAATDTEQSDSSNDLRPCKGVPPASCDDSSPLRLADIMEEIHKYASRSADGRWEVAEIAFSDAAKSHIEDAVAEGFIEMRRFNDFGPYLSLSVTDRGRGHFILLKVTRTSTFAKVVKGLRRLAKGGSQ